jgi:3'-5' exoribonuclease
MVLSHHGQLEFGSPKLPEFPEALLLHYLDDMDSKMECMRALIENDRQVEGCFTSYYGPLERVALKKERFLNGGPAAPRAVAARQSNGAADAELSTAAPVAPPALAAHPLFAAKPEPLAGPRAASGGPARSGESATRPARVTEASPFADKLKQALGSETPAPGSRQEN